MKLEAFSLQKHYNNAKVWHVIQSLQQNKQRTSKKGTKNKQKGKQCHKREMLFAATVEK